ncbi:hypothetical protein TNCV_4111721 [Trichonephila clavipes]|nr:hypothetical protein TNCV_4111721 [Trichonephila clavipes]
MCNGLKARALNILLKDITLKRRRKNVSNMQSRRRYPVDLPEVKAAKVDPNVQLQNSGSRIESFTDNHRNHCLRTPNSVVSGRLQRYCATGEKEAEISKCTQHPTPSPTGGRMSYPQI